MQSGNVEMFVILKWPFMSRVPLGADLEILEEEGIS